LDFHYGMDLADPSLLKRIVLTNKEKYMKKLSLLFLMPLLTVAGSFAFAQTAQDDIGGMYYCTKPEVPQTSSNERELRFRTYRIREGIVLSDKLMKVYADLETCVAKARELNGVNGGPL
jgi:hypothetical protein